MNSFYENRIILNPNNNYNKLLLLKLDGKKADC